MIVIPIGSYYVTVDNLFNGKQQNLELYTNPAARKKKIKRKKKSPTLSANLFPAQATRPMLEPSQQSWPT